MEGTLAIGVDQWSKVRLSETPTIYGEVESLVIDLEPLSETTPVPDNLPKLDDRLEGVAFWPTEVTALLEGVEIALLVALLESVELLYGSLSVEYIPIAIS